jgi:hypothetical protein
MIAEGLLLQVLITAYAGAGIIGAAAYWPTIKDLYYHKKLSANVSTYKVWTATSGIAFLYSLFILPDLFFRIASGVGFALCALILFLSIRLKKMTK